MATFSSSSMFQHQHTTVVLDSSPRSSSLSDHHHQQNLDQISTKLPDLVVVGNNEGSFTANKNSSTMRLTQKMDASMVKKRKSNEGSSSNSAKCKGKKQKKVKHGHEIKKKSTNEDKEASNGYIHVRAKRGQATDSHSLAERVRREKISERMKLLQALVPGCEKVTGKALMLDEIINYVQSLQNQVEFLSMKLASLNPILYDFGMMDLGSLMVKPADQDLNSLPSPLQSMQQCSLALTANHYPIFMDKSTQSLLLHHDHITWAHNHGHRQVLWEVDDQRHKIMDQSGFNNSSLFSFN